MPENPMSDNPREKAPIQRLGALGRLLRVWMPVWAPDAPTERIPALSGETTGEILQNDPDLPNSQTDANLAEPESESESESETDPENEQIGQDLDVEVILNPLPRGSAPNASRFANISVNGRILGWAEFFPARDRKKKGHYIACLVERQQNFRKPLIENAIQGRAVEAEWDLQVLQWVLEITKIKK